MEALSSSTAIHRAFRIAAQAGREIEALENELVRMFKGLNDNTYRFENFRTDKNYESGNSAWVTSSYCISFKGKRVKDRGPSWCGALSYIVDFATDDGLAEEIDRAVLIVGWSPEKDDPWTMENFKGLVPMWIQWEADEDNEAGKHQLVGKSIVLELFDRDEGGSMVEQQWWYAVPLGEIATREDVTQLLVDPVLSLLHGQSDDIALDESLSRRLVQFEEQGKYLVPKIQGRELTI